MKFLLVTSQNKNLVKLWACQETSHIGSLLPPVDLCSIAASLHKNEHIVKISDLRLFKNPLATYSEELASFKPDAIILNITTTSANYDYEIIKSTPKIIKKIVSSVELSQPTFDCTSQSSNKEADKGLYFVADETNPGDNPPPLDS